MSAALLGTPDALATLSTWLLTYWVHSAIACVLALAAGRLLLRRPLDRDVVWKLALVVPLLTSGAAAFGWSSAIGGARLDGPRALHRVVPAHWAPISVDADVRVLNGTEVSTTRVDDPLAGGAAALVVAFAALLALAGGIAVVRRRLELARLVRSRRPALARDAGASIIDPRVRVSESTTLSSPVALGRDEICVPSSFWTLSAPQQRSVVAHELAHLDRRDPLWIGIMEWIAALSAFQPLARRVSAAFRRDAEFICDELAVRRTGEPHPLVESLAALARAFDPAASTPQLAAGYDGSPLVERAARVLALDPSRAGERRSARVWWCVGVAALLLLGVLPAVSMRATVPERGSMRVPVGSRAVVDTTVVVDRGVEPRTRR